LTAPPDVLEARLTARRGHFAPPALLESQLEELEPPQDAITVDAQLEVKEIVDQICAALIS
jgi:gluconate kinase